MALKRVSDLERRRFEDITNHIEDEMYDNSGSNKNYNKLRFSKIEVSEVIDNDDSCSLFQSYAYDIHALSGLFNDGILNRDITINGDKNFTKNVRVNGNFTINNNNKIEMDSVLFDINTDDFNINVNNNITMNSPNYTITGDNLNLSVNNSNIGIKNLVLSGDNLTLIYRNTFKIQYCDSTGKLNDVLVLGNRNNKPTSSFPNNTDVSNPINGCINKAMWA